MRALAPRTHTCAHRDTDEQDLDNYGENDEDMRERIEIESEVGHVSISMFIFLYILCGQYYPNANGATAPPATLRHDSVSTILSSQFHSGDGCNAQNGAAGSTYTVVDERVPHSVDVYVCARAATHDNLINEYFELLI
jgi:hypothetical protein